MPAETTTTTVAKVLRALSGGGDFALPLLSAAVPGGLSTPVQAGLRGAFAALGLVADLLERGAEPVVQIETWRSSLSEVSEIDREAEDALRKAGL